MNHLLALVVFEVGLVRVVGSFYRADEKSRYEFREAVIELRAKDALGGERWENCGSMRSETTNYENKLSYAVACVGSPS